jgi:hypothetical protein
MGHFKGLVLLAGAALSVSGTAAFAQSNDEVRATVAQMLNDAETRSSLLAGGDAGHDGRFFIAGDGFRLNIGGLLQFRYDLNFRGNSDIAAGQDDFTHGFQTRRVKLDFNGELNKDWFFRVRLTNDSESSGSLSYDYAYAGYKFANGWKATWGQFKLPLLREELVSDSKQLAAERSIVNGMFTQGYSQGVELAYEAETWRAFFAFSDGLNSANTDFNSRQNINVPPGGNPTLVVSGQGEYGLTGRGEFMLSGNWKQFEDFTSAKGSDFGCMLGAAVHYQQSDNTGNPTDSDLQTLRYTIDASFEGDSWNAYAAFIGDHSKARNFGGNSPDFDNFGFVGQGGWRFAENTEVFGRYEFAYLDNDLVNAAATGSGKNKFHFLTAGLNQYYAGHAAKATADVVYSFQDTSNLAALGYIPNTGVGLLGQAKSGEVVIRLQFQLMF